MATRAEIERIQAGLASVGNLLGGEVELSDFLISPLKRIGLAMELPAVQERIRYLLQALDAAANEYFHGEALVARELTDLGLISAPIIASGLIGLANEVGIFREHRVKVTQVDRFWRQAPRFGTPDPAGYLGHREGGLFEFHDHIVDLQAGACGGVDLLDHPAPFGLEDVFHLHGFDNGEFLTSLYFLTNDDSHFP